jgi:hypothetical protein
MVFITFVTPLPVLMLLFRPGALEFHVLPVLLSEVITPGAVLSFIPFVIVPRIAVIIPVIGRMIAVIGS